MTCGAQGITAIDGNGTPSDTTDDRIIYVPNPGATGADSFSYTISDGDGCIATATGDVTINNLVDLSGRVQNFNFTYLKTKAKLTTFHTEPL